jgi:hypothetical protein
MSVIVCEKIAVEGFCFGASSRPVTVGAPPDQFQTIGLGEHFDPSEGHRRIPTRSDGVERIVNTPFPGKPEQEAQLLQ